MECCTSGASRAAVQTMMGKRDGGGRKVGEEVGKGGNPLHGQ